MSTAPKVKAGSSPRTPKAGATLGSWFCLQIAFIENLVNAGVIVHGSFYGGPLPAAFQRTRKEIVNRLRAFWARTVDHNIRFHDCSIRFQCETREVSRIAAVSPKPILFVPVKTPPHRVRANVFREQYVAVRSSCELEYNQCSRLSSYVQHHEGVLRWKGANLINDARCIYFARAEHKGHEKSEDNDGKRHPNKTRRRPRAGTCVPSLRVMRISHLAYRIPHPPYPSVSFITRRMISAESTPSLSAWKLTRMRWARTGSATACTSSRRAR